MASLSDILAHPIFAGVDRAQITDCVERLQVVRVEKGEAVTGPVSARRCLCLVLAGILHPFILTSDGKRLVLEIVGPGGFDGLLFATGDEGHFCEAATPAEVVPVSNGELREMIAAEPRIATNLLELTLEQLSRREAHMAALAQGEGLRRVAQQLAAIGRYAGRADGDWRELVPRPTHQSLSEMIGLRRETVTVQLGVLRQLGAVEPRTGVLRVNLRRLAAVVEGTR